MNSEGEPEMKSSHLRTLLVAVLLITILSACSRPASKAPVATTTPTIEMPFPMPGQPTVIKDIAAGTMTAQAMLNPQVATLQPTSDLVVVASPTPVPPTPVIVYTATPGIPATYTMQLGDTVYCLARRYNLDPSAIISANPSLNADSIRDGTTINLPQGPIWPESMGSRARNAHPGTYSVGASETIYHVACYYGDVSPEAIAQANGLVAPYALATGQSLIIP
jgi:LysM repeat protein